MMRLLVLGITCYLMLELAIILAEKKGKMKHLKDYITVNGQEYYVSTKNTFDVGFETMVFKSKDKYVVDWIEEYYKHYAAKGEAIKGHNYIVNNLEKCLEEGNAQDW